MTVTTFGVTSTSVYALHFPQLPAPSGNSKPSAANCAIIIDEAAADLAGELTKAGITPSGLTSATAPYLWCSKTLRLDCAVRFAQAGTGGDPKVVKAWREEWEKRLTNLQVHGGSALGDSSLGTSTVSTHINEYGLDVGDPATDGSDVVPPFRKDDQP